MLKTAWLFNCIKFIILVGLIICATQTHNKLLGIYCIIRFTVFVIARICDIINERNESQDV